MKTKILLLTVLASVLFSFSGSKKKEIEFAYPDRKEAQFTMNSDKFKKFIKEWRGEDYYYMCSDDPSEIICSVLFYKLNKDEEKGMVGPFGGKTLAGIPFIYFSEHSNLKKYERNNLKWGDMADDFMFRQNDIFEMQGMKVSQKNMYAYAMFGTDLFVNMHLSKVNCSAEDSTLMRELLASLTKKK